MVICVFLNVGLMRELEGACDAQLLGRGPEFRGAHFRNFLRRCLPAHGVIALTLGSEQCGLRVLYFERGRFNVCELLVGHFVSFGLIAV